MSYNYDKMSPNSLALSFIASYKSPKFVYTLSIYLISLNSCRPDSTTTEESVIINGELNGKAKARKSHANPSPKAATIAVRRNA